METIEPITNDDLPEILALVRSVWTMGSDSLRERTYGPILGEPWQEKIARSVRDYLAGQTVSAFKATIDGRFAGFLSFRHEGVMGEIGYNAVHPDFQGRGLGQRLLQVALKALEEQGVCHVEVVTGLDDGHAPARATYEKAGFKVLAASVRYTLALNSEKHGRSVAE